jgi:Protein of unknown function (DUF2911)
MKRISYLLCFLVLFQITSIAQEKKVLSPKETVTAKAGDANIEIVYSRPSSRGRSMIGGNEAYGSVWRTGANEATTIQFDKAVKIEGKDLAAGKYALFTIPGEKEWTIIFNKDHKQWGAYNYKKEDDVLRVTVPARKPKSFVETFTITADKNAVVLAWENSEVSFSVK